MVVGGLHHAPAASPPGKTRYPLYRSLGGPQTRSERMRKISPPPGFDPRNVQPVASRYTDCTIDMLISGIIFVTSETFFITAGWPENRASTPCRSKQIPYVKYPVRICGLLKSLSSDNWGGGGSFPRDKVVWAWSWPLTSICFRD